MRLNFSFVQLLLFYIYQGKLFAIKSAHDDVYEVSNWKRYTSLLLVASDTCLPMMDMSDRGADKRHTFLDMECGLGHFENADIEDICEEFLGDMDERLDVSCVKCIVRQAHIQKHEYRHAYIHTCTHTHTYIRG